MKNHESEISIFSELQAKINTNRGIEEFGLLVTTEDFDVIMKESSKTCPEPDKYCYKLLRKSSKTFPGPDK